MKCSTGSNSDYLLVISQLLGDDDHVYVSATFDLHFLVHRAVSTIRFFELDSFEPEAATASLAGTSIFATSIPCLELSR